MFPVFERVPARHILTALLIGGLLGACQQADNMKPVPLDIADAPGSGASVGEVDKAVLAPAGDYSLTTVRKRPDVVLDNGTREIICTAPSPDWATALAKAMSGSASGGAAGGPSGSLSVSSSLSETISALAGRTAGVVALRDGLYKACEAYANGVIGKDTYALIVSQYGNLLVALAGSSASGGAGSGGAASPSSVPTGVTVAVSGATASPSATPSTTTQTPSGSTPANTAVATQLQLSIVEALVVSCISENDPTVPRGELKLTAGNIRHADANLLLTDASGKPTKVCQDLMTTIADAAKTLLAPAPAGGGSQPQSWTVVFTAYTNFAAGATDVIKAAATVIGKGATKATVTGFTDSSGNPMQNHEVALGRANAVIDELVKDGVSAANLTAMDGSSTTPKLRQAVITIGGASK